MRSKICDMNHDFFLTLNSSSFSAAHSCTGAQNCGECGTLPAYKRHKKIHSKQKEKAYCCSTCGKSFIKKAFLINHERIHTGHKPFKCGKCGRSFAERGNMTQHEKRHTGEKSNVCGICGKLFHRRYDLLRHLKIHTKK